MKDPRSNMELKERLQLDFQDRESKLNGSATEPLHQLRQKAMQAFVEMGFPEVRLEDWKYTSVRSVIEQDLGLANSGENTKADIDALLIPELESHVLVSINGHYSSALSNLDDIEEGVYAGDIHNIPSELKELFNQHFCKHADYDRDGFSALSTAYSFEGVFIYIPKGVKLSKPVQLLHILDTHENATLAQPRCLLVAGENSQCTLIENLNAVGKEAGLINATTEIVAGAYSKVDYYKIQTGLGDSAHIGTCQISQDNNSEVNAWNFCWSGGLVRNNLNARHREEHATTGMFGLSFLDGSRHLDNHTLMDHAVPNGSSNEDYRGILLDSSQGVFNGRILVQKDAQQTKAYQSIKHLLLSDNATVDAKPQLEIFANDVECSHGATCGQLDPEELFYMRSRGITEMDAKALLLAGFGNEILDKIPIGSLRKQLSKSLSNKLKIEL